MTPAEINEPHSSHEDPVSFMHSCIECKAIVNRYQERELNEAVARKLGWEVRLPSRCESDEPEHAHINHLDRGLWCLPDYSTSIEAAFEIVEKWKIDGFYLDLACNLKGIKDWKCTVCDVKITYPEREFVSSEADTAPLAICLAFLKLGEVKV